MFRSKTIKAYRIYFVSEFYESIMEIFIDKNFVQFESVNSNLNDSFEKKNMNKLYIEIKKNIDDIEQAYKIIEKYDKKVNILTDFQKEEIMKDLLNESHDNENKYLKFEFEERIRKKLQSLIINYRDYDLLKEKIIDLEESEKVYKLIEKYYGINEFDRTNNNLSLINHLILLIDNKKYFDFKKFIFRITRGHYIEETKEIKDKKVVFISFQDSSYISSRLNLYIKNYELKNFKIPLNNKDIKKEFSHIKYELKNLKELKKKLKLNIDTDIYILQKQENGKNFNNLNEYKLLIKTSFFLQEEKKKFIQKTNSTEGLLWVEEENTQFLKQTINYIEKKFQTPVTINLSKASKYIKPTSFIKNDFTGAFLKIDKLYSMSSYKEINPSFFGLVFFPFMFGVMFGDIGHGFLLFSISICLFVKRKVINKDLNEFKWMLLFMSLFSIFCGFIYNDFFSVPFVIQKSCYFFKGEEVFRKTNCVYNFGIDYIWKISKNENQFLNSFKMKTSIIFGVTHMILAMLMDGLNLLYFKHYLDFFIVFIPKMIFFISIFGYMCFSIILKWFMDYSKNPGSSPSIISQFINFINKPDNLLFESQYQIQHILFIIAVCSLITLFLAKPIITTIVKAFKNRKKKKQYIELTTIREHEDLSIKSNYENISLIDSDDFQEEEDHKDEGIEHLIESIEFILGSISNTASYLRLWALSLAHSQLSQVFLTMILYPFLNSENGYFFNTIGIVIAFPMFLMITFFVLIVMDCMECFLHALRLHWVEFQNKFVIGDGKEFVGLSKFSIISDF